MPQSAFAGNFQLSVLTQGAEEFENVTWLWECNERFKRCVLSFGQSREAWRNSAGYATLVNNCLCVTTIECSAFSAMNKVCSEQLCDVRSFNRANLFNRYI